MAVRRKNYKKADFPVSDIRQFLEPGPVVLVSSKWKNKTNIMTMGWHTVMEFSPSLIGCVISNGNHSYDMIRKSKACVINIPTTDLIHEVTGIGNCSGSDTDKFAKFKLTAHDAAKVNAPLIKECFANFVCKVVDTTWLRKYNFFVLEVVKALVARQPKYPETMHYRGKGRFMIAGKEIALPGKYK
jgi:flavin reductase (DIM6/NTAB) family NADH-FMN oxidoreductase RutF